MESVIHISPVFTPGPRGTGTLDFTNLGIDIRDIHAVYNLSRGSVAIYANSAGFGPLALAAGPIITLNVDTSNHSSGDLLTVVGEASGGGGGGSSVDRELVVSTYVVKTAFTGASVGDTVTCTQILDVSGVTTTVSTIWRNQTTGADFGSVPSASNLTLVGAGSATAANQVTQISALQGIQSLTTAQLSTLSSIQALEQITTSQLTALTSQATAALQSAQLGVLTNIQAALPTLVRNEQPVIQPDINAASTVAAGGIGTWVQVFGRGGLGLVLSGTWAGSVVLEASIDGTTPAAINTAPLEGGANALARTANGSYIGIASGVAWVRINASAVTSGTVGYALLLTDNTRVIRAWSTSAANFLASVNLRDGAGNAINSTNSDLNVALRAQSLMDGSQQPVNINASGALFVSNTRDRFRDAFTSKNSNFWNFPVEILGPGNHTSRIDGNVAGESYLAISLSATAATGTEWVLSGIPRLVVPYELEVGLTMSQRVNGQEINFELVGVNDSGTVLSNSSTPAVAITQLVSTGTTTATLTASTDINFRVGDPIYIYGFADSRCNQQTLLVQSIGGFGLNPARVFTITTPAIIPAGTYTLGSPFVKKIDHTAGARYAVGNRYSGTTSTNIDLVSVNNDPAPRVVTLNAGTAATVAIIPNEGGLNYASLNFTQAFRTAFASHIEHTSKRILWRSRAIDSVLTDNSSSLRRMPIPLHDTASGYILRARVKNLETFPVPIAPILRAEKVAASSVKITQAGHSVAVGDILVVYGNRDITNFANATTLVAVTAATGSDFTISYGATGTSQVTAGGFYAKVPSAIATNTAPAHFLAANVSTYSKSADGLRMVLVGAATFVSVLVVGEVITVYGLVETATVTSTVDGVRRAQWEGRYRVAMVSTTTVELEPLDGQDLTAMSGSAVNAGGALIRNTEVRLHYVRVYDRSRIEIDNSKQGHTNEADPVAIVGNPTINISQISGTTTVTGGLAGTLAVGGAAANGVAPTTNPNLIGGVDSSGLMRRLQTTVSGGVTGAGELQYPGFTFTAVSPTEGTGARTFAGVAGRECLLEIGVIAQGNAASTMNVCGSFDGQLFSVIPLSRVDSFANNQYMAYCSGATSSAFAPASNSTYQARCYGYQIIRLQQPAFTTAGTQLTYMRLMPLPATPGELMSPFTLDAQNTTEAAGTAAGALMAGGVRTLPINVKGNAKAILDLDAFTYATAAPTSSSLIVEGLQGGVWAALPLTPMGGGNTITAITSVGALPGASGNAFLSGRWETDVTGMVSVRVRWSAYTAGTATNARYHGVLRVVPVPGTTSYKPTYSYRQSGIAATAATNVLGIEAGAARAVTIKRLIVNGGSATAATLATLTLNRQTAAGSTGAVTPTVALHNRDAGDPVFSGTLRSSGYTAGTNAATTMVWDIPVTATGTVNTNTVTIDLTNGGEGKGVVIPAGVANGALFIFGGTAGGAGLTITAEWTEE